MLRHLPDYTKTSSFSFYIFDRIDTEFEKNFIINILNLLG